jgi:hypothetical protein
MVLDSDGSQAPLSFASKHTRACPKYVVDIFGGVAPEGGVKRVPPTTPRTVEADVTGVAAGE